MPALHGVELRRRGGGGDLPHRPACLAVCNPSAYRLALILGFLLLACAAGLRAQSRGDMQVGARVLMAGPSRVALAAALNRPAAAELRALAQIRRDGPAVARDSAGVALPPRSIITIAFLRN